MATNFWFLYSNSCYVERTSGKIVRNCHLHQTLNIASTEHMIFVWHIIVMNIFKLVHFAGHFKSKLASERQKSFGSRYPSNYVHISNQLYTYLYTSCNRLSVLHDLSGK